MALECPMCKNPFGSGGKRVHTNPPVALRWASRSAGLTCGFSPGLCNLPRKPSANTDLGLDGPGVEAAADEASASAGFAGFGSCCLQSTRVSQQGPAQPHPETWAGEGAYLALGLRGLLRTKPIRQRGFDGVLHLEGVRPAQRRRVPERRNGRAHVRPSCNSRRVDKLGNGIRERLRSDAESYGRRARRRNQMMSKRGRATLWGADRLHIRDQIEPDRRAASGSRET